MVTIMDRSWWVDNPDISWVVSPGVSSEWFSSVVNSGDMVLKPSSSSDFQVVSLRAVPGASFLVSMLPDAQSECRDCLAPLRLWFSLPEL